MHGSLPVVLCSHLIDFRGNMGHDDYPINAKSNQRQKEEFPQASIGP